MRGNSMKIKMIFSLQTPPFILALILMIMPLLALAQEEAKAPRRHYSEFDEVSTGHKYDDLTLSSGFGSRYSWGSSGGKVDASRFGENCVGWIAKNPDHTITVQRTTTKMSVTAVIGNDDGDLSLLIKGPNGQILCDDNSADGLNPQISAEFSPGIYQIFVGYNVKQRRNWPPLLYVFKIPWIVVRDFLRFFSVLERKPERHSGNAQYYLEIMEDGYRTTRIAQHDTQGRNGNFNIGAGFTPDPQTATGMTGNPDIPWVDASDKFGSQCTGILHSRPDHRLTVTSKVNLNLAVSGQADSSLVVSGPAGTFCGDRHVNAAFTPGEYEIYVGSFGDSGEYMLTISGNETK